MKLQVIGGRLFHFLLDFLVVVRKVVGVGVGVFVIAVKGGALEHSVGVSPSLSN